MLCFACTGGGARGVAVAGVLHQGQVQNKWHPDAFNAITGDSFGALIAALVANHWRPAAMAQLFLDTDFKALLTPLPWGVRKAMMLLRPLPLAPIAKFIDGLGLASSPRLFINAWDAEDNRQVIYCERKPAWAVNHPALPITWVENAFTDIGLGTVIARSMALPGLVADSPRWMDGGLGEHPPLSFLPQATRVLLLNLGFAGLVPRIGDTTPTGLVDRGLYAYEVTASIRQRLMVQDLNNVVELNPHIYDVDSLALNLDAKAKAALIRRGSQNTQLAWRAW